MSRRILLTALICLLSFGPYSYGAQYNVTIHPGDTLTVNVPVEAPPPIPMPLPSMPVGVAASDGIYEDRVSIAWNAATDAESYDVYRGTANAFSSAIIVVNTANTAFDDSSAVPGTTYYYWVVAKNSVGSSAPSASDAGYIAVVAPPPPPPPPPIPVPTAGKNVLGVNLPGPDEWNSGARVKLFGDLARTARFIDGNPATSSSKWLVLTVTNNQVQAANWATFGSRQPDITGVYTLKCDTTGNVSTTNGAVVKVADGIWTVAVYDNTRDVRIDFTQPVSNLRMYRQDALETETTTKAFRDFVQPFSFIRFMDLMVTNWADENDAAERLKALGSDGMMDWAERPSDNGSYHRPWGISVEAAVRICNESKKDMWICLSHVVTNDYLTHLSQYLSDNLDGDLNVYIEFSNEIWNYAYGFYQSGMVRDTALAYVAAGKTPKLDNPPENGYYYAQRYALLRLHDALGILSPALGNRVRPIFSSQFGSGYYANALNWSSRTFGNNDWIYGLACAPYIWATDGTVDDIVATLKKDIASRQEIGNKMAVMRGLCDSFLENNNLFFYEMGIDMDQGTNNLSNKIAATYDPKMGPVVTSYLVDNFAFGGVLGGAWFNGASTRDKWGPAWALTDDTADLSQPMYKAAAEFAADGRPTGGLTAEFFKKDDFATLLGTKVVPMVNHYWQNWLTGPTLDRATWNPTLGLPDSSIRFTGKYTPSATANSLVVEIDSNDVATLHAPSSLTPAVPVDIELEYKAKFGGNGKAYVRLLEVDATGKRSLVRQNQLTP